MKSKDTRKNRKNLCELGKAERVNAGARYQEARRHPSLIRGYDDR
jgi:hypothetical protein